MNVSTTVDQYEPTLIKAVEVPRGKVYSWGDKVVSYLRVKDGSICLTNWDFIPIIHPHFSMQGPRVQIAEKADLTIKYKA